MNMYTTELTASAKAKLKEFRHPLNKNLLCKAGGRGHIEIMDRKTRAIVYIGPSRKHNDDGLKGAEFQAFSRDVKCPSCSRLLCRGLGMNLDIEIKCIHCKEVYEFNMRKLYETSFKTLPIKIQEKLQKQIKDLTF